MEMASLRKRIVCIPSARPFEEQIIKAAHLERLRLALVIQETHLFDTNWNGIVRIARQLDPDRWSTIMDDEALSKIGKALYQTFDRFFAQKSSTTKPSEKKYA